MQSDLPRRIAREFDIPLQLAQFLSLLILNEFVTTRRVYDDLGTTECRALAFRLRKAVPSVTLNSRRFIGYWLTPNQRSELASTFGVVIETKAVAS